MAIEQAKQSSEEAARADALREAGAKHEEELKMLREELQK